MANRNRAYYRKMRVKHINRKKRINRNCGWYWHYEYDGMYSKGKIHCSCGMCLAKTRNKNYKRRHIHGNYSPNINYKPSDLRKIEAMDQAEKDWNEESLDQDHCEDKDIDYTDVNVSDGLLLDGNYLDYLISSIDF